MYKLEKTQNTSLFTEHILIGDIPQFTALVSFPLHCYNMLSLKASNGDYCRQNDTAVTPCFLQCLIEWGGQRVGQDILGGQIYMVANNALRQYGTHTPLFQVSPLSLDLSFLFASCDSFPFHLSFIPISRPSPPLVQLWVWGSAVSSPSGSGRSPAAKCNLVNSGPRNERF